MKIALKPTPLKRGDRISMANLESPYSRETWQIEEFRFLPKLKRINSTKFPNSLTLSFKEVVL